MVLFLVVAIFFGTIVFWEIWALGKYLADKNIVFQNNNFAYFVFGSSIWFALSFATMVPLVFFEIDIVYFVIVLVVKEFITIVFLSGRDFKLYKQLNIKLIIQTLITIWVITILYNLVLEPYLINKTEWGYGEFNTFERLITSISYISGISNQDIYQWVMVPIGITIIFSTINYLLVKITKRVSDIDFIITILLVMTILSGFLVEFALFEIVSFSFLIWSFYLATEIINQSRRRYTVFYSLAFIAAWSINQYVYGAFIALAILTTLIYSAWGGRKVYVFWLQLILPLVIIAGFYLYDFSIWLSLSSIIGLLTVYIMLSFKFTQRLHKILNAIFYKTRFILPSAILLSIYITGIILLVKEPTSSIFINHGLIKYQGQVANIINISLYILLVTSLLWVNTYFYTKKKRLIKSRLMLRYLLWYVIFIYNPLFESILHFINIESQYIFPFSYAIWIPAIIILINTTKDSIQEYWMKRI